ncbi:hypothetical protein KBK19_06665 [Microvirga sp. STR05]|uniref:Uncharacterized protein n=1 Tax=Hymenobacter duratus TaxID=2771356 RepID=A0ABR8JFX3_9BACT|nr:hypothetical protein [Hymenobacter duratus]MBD2714710.1 hypothetical protein [Hymenobacter duratus]MBR7949614.1 hypothetical protein [Microvirga sp. STR05]
MKYLDSKESGIWKLRTKVYNVKFDKNCFLIKRRGGNANGPIYPLVKGEIIQNEFIQVNLDIKPAYYLIIGAVLCSLALLYPILTDEKMTVNGVYRSVGLLERMGWAAFVLAVPGFICYFKTIKPVRDAENWLIEKLKLEPISS